MRKTTIFLSLLVMVAMLLAACGAEETSTSVPSTDVPPVTVESTATDELPSDTDTTPTVDANTTTTPGVPVTGEESLSRLSNLLDLDVWNQEDDQIGEVDDMVLDMNNTNISYVIVGTGGFLEIGEKEVLVPWNSLQVGLTGNQENAFILQTEQEAFENAPDIDVDEVVPERGAPASDWDNDIRNYWESGVVPNTPAADATAVPDATATVDAGTAEGQGQSGPLQGVMLASDVLGSTITIGASQGVGEGQGAATVAPASGTAMPDATVTAEIGTGVQDNNVQAAIDDVIVDPETGDILYFVVDASLTEGQRWIPVPFGAFQWDADNEMFVLRANVNALQNAPFFEDGQYPDTTTPGWDDEFDTFWQNPDAGATVTP